jgi:hypothetical protein
MLLGFLSITFQINCNIYLKLLLYLWNDFAFFFNLVSKFKVGTELKII